MNTVPHTPRQPAHRIVLIVFLSGLIICVLIGVAIRIRGYSYEVRNVAYGQIANEWAVRRLIPPQARRISAWIRPYSRTIVAAFAIEQQEFVNWANARGWPLEEITQTTVLYISKRCDPNESVLIEDGFLYEWEYDPSDPSTTTLVYAFDKTEGVGYLTRHGAD